MSSLRALALFLAASLALIACSRSGSEAPAGTVTRAGASPGVVDGTAVVAEVNGESITRAELDEEAAAPLARLRQEEFEIRRRVLESLIVERLVESTARERGISTEELLEKEIDQDVSKPPAAQVASVYERNQARFAGQTREQAYARIEELLQERALAESRRDFESGLRRNAKVTVHLEAPRAVIALPDNALARGPEDAPVTIVEFSDYQCPFCHRAQGVIDQLLDKYKDQVRLVHLDFPLENHPGAVPAARAVRCAAEQGQFWDYHRSLMTDRGSLDRADLARRAAALQLDSDDFEECLASDRFDEAIRAELEQGSALGVTGTPAYFINGRMISGAQPYPAFAEIIDAELAGD